MKQGIHPEFMTAAVVCACGNRFETMATVDKHVDAREIKMIEQFARRWRVDPPQLQEGET